MSITSGFLYIATGQKYLKEAIVSATSFKKLMPEIPIALATSENMELSNDVPFDKIDKIEEVHYNYLDKILPLKQSPFQKTVFLDTDTHCFTPCYDLFEILDSFDCALAHAPVRENWKSNHVTAPLSFPEYNSGVIAFRNKEPFREIIKAWHYKYVYFKTLKEPPAHDQAALRQVLFESDLKICTLPPEYNLRTCFSYFIGGNSIPKIIHDRGTSLKNSIEWIEENGTTHSRPRVFDRNSI